MLTRRTFLVTLPATSLLRVDFRTPNQPSGKPW